MIKYRIPDISEFIQGFEYEELYPKSINGTVNRTEDYWRKEKYEIKNVIWPDKSKETLYPKSLNDIKFLIDKGEIRVIDSEASSL